jgi:hypothetical protein
MKRGVERYTETVTLRRWEKRRHEGGRPDERFVRVRADLEVVIDMEGLFRELADKALGSKYGKVSVCGGLITAKVRRIKPNGE